MEEDACTGRGLLEQPTQREVVGEPDTSATGVLAVRSR